MSKQTRILNYVPQAGEGVSILLYGDVGAWGDITAERVATELLALEGQYSHIDVHINSVGGDVFTGIAIYNTLRLSRADIRIYVDGLAASIAGVIALCGKPLYMSQYARLMLHKVSGGAYGSARELRQTAELIESLEDSLAEMIASKVKMSKEEAHAKFFADGEDHWLTAQEALSLGIIDGIHDLPEETELAEDSSKEDIYRVFNNRLRKEAQSNNKDMALIDDIKSIPSFANVSEQNIVSTLKEREAKYREMENKVATLEAEQLEAIVNTAIADGRISEAQKPMYLNLMKSDRENTEALLNSMPRAKVQTPRGEAPSARHYVQPGGKAEPRQTENAVFAGKTWDELDRSGELANFKKEDPEGFASAYKARYGVEYN